MAISEKVLSRISDGIKKYQPSVREKAAQDVSEADTVNLVRLILSDVLGFDNLKDITSEHKIGSVRCDLAVKINEKTEFLIEVKSAGTVHLNDSNILQAVNYATHEPVDWVILTNAVKWKIFLVKFGKPVSYELISEIDFSTLNSKNREEIEKMYLLSKEVISKSSLKEFYNQTQATSKHIVGNLIYTDSIVHAIKKELKQIFPNIKVTPDEIKNVLINEVIKREILEGDACDDAKRRIARVNKRKEKADGKVISNTNNPVNSEIIATQIDNLRNQANQTTSFE